VTGRMQYRASLAGIVLFLAVAAAGVSLRTHALAAAREPIHRFAFPATETPAAVRVKRPSADRPGDERYVGSESCRRCHQEIYAAWSETLHSHSIIEAKQARQAGYRLPQGVRWEAVSYVIGGRKRIALADSDQIIQPVSYQHRRGVWTSFPSKPMPCTPCHYTGVDKSGSSFQEMNIGCESCHGPGGKHARTYRREDIRVGASSRVCGDCHTQVNRVLPKDEAHETHDTVQVWTRDPHAVHLVRNSHNRFCARCHSPYDGPSENFSEAEAPVFSESKQNISCVGCHDPHRVTNTAYRRNRARLDSPLPVNSHVLRGIDHDLSTRDYLDFRNTEETCVHCHSGADRIDLDHGNASCTDCHNRFQYNRTRESRVSHSPLHPGLSCRQCHRNGDELLAVVSRDPVFLSPKYIHNLRRLPEEAVRKYALKYSRLPPFRRVDSSSGLAEEPYVAQASVDRRKPQISADALKTRIWPGLLQGTNMQKWVREAFEDSLNRIPVSPNYPPLRAWSSLPAA
jgi:hypothetical protein